jgi:hypothetical protein
LALAVRQSQTLLVLKETHLPLLLLFLQQVAVAVAVVQQQVGLAAVILALPVVE